MRSKPRSERSFPRKLQNDTQAIEVSRPLCSEGLRLLEVFAEKQPTAIPYIPHMVATGSLVIPFVEDPNWLRFYDHCNSCEVCSFPE